MFLFGKQKTPKEVLRENQRDLNKSMREIDRERMNLQNQEKKIIMDIKKMAKQGQMNSAKIMAKDLVRTRFHIQKFYEMRTQLQAVSLRIQTLQSTQSMAEAMKGVTKAMMVMNKQMNLPQFTKIMMEFEQQSDRMDMKEEMMNDTMDSVMEQDDEEEKSQEILNQVLDEIGIDLASQLVDTPTATAQTVSSAHKVHNG
ncbi:SNF7 family protein [Tieghemostelium lacteum]|uniref:SNF7 family protein n=1 Tax=Tieghemostelium lacteum TaxID=361077 RepID=A0A151ZEM6_TIELA|nr:SNF7 family protein [Tieghemostelium lacteum]|eukprot:KYQ92408.1 SNF7 family protein [Tieghemostelium lacteum]